MMTRNRAPGLEPSPVRGRSWVRALSLFSLAALIILGASPAVSAARASSAYRVKSLCGIPSARVAACTGLALVPASLTTADIRTNAEHEAKDLAVGVHPAVNKKPIPGYLTPQLLHAAYELPTETSLSASQTIAVVDAYDDPTAEADLAVFDTQFGLPACTTSNGCFRKVNEKGNASPLPEAEDGWAGEITIDVQMAHAICQNCHILLVEANSETSEDLGVAANTAVRLGASAVSNSYGSVDEKLAPKENEEYYNHPGVVITAAAGDCGYVNQNPERALECEGRREGVLFPASSPDVVAVGGTSLSESEGSWSSTVWENTGGGCSLFSAPSWQTAVAGWSATGCGSERLSADVSAIGNPNTGVDVYDSTPYARGYPTGWAVFGGTSVASPIVASEYALAGGARGVEYPARTLYSHVGEGGALYDVLTGSNGSCGGTTACRAAPGYDGPSGVGSPVGLAAFSPTSGSPVNTSPPTVSGTAIQGHTLSETHGGWENDPTSFGYQWEDCNTAGTGCLPITGATAQTYTLAASDAGSTIRVQETTSNAAGFGPPAFSAQTGTVTGPPKIGGFTPASGITGSAVTISGSGFTETSEVEFGALVAGYRIVSATEIEATVPSGAKAGKITVTAPLGSAASTAKFTPTLSVTALSPTKDAPGKIVKIKGLGFTHHSSVSFNGTAAQTVTYVSSKELKVIVPAGASTGKLTVTNTEAPSGTVSSASSFTVT
jgi:hypothetical protein